MALIVHSGTRSQRPTPKAGISRVQAPSRNQRLFFFLMTLQLSVAEAPRTDPNTETCASKQTLILYPNIRSQRPAPKAASACGGNAAPFCFFETETRDLESLIPVSKPNPDSNTETSASKPSLILYPVIRSQRLPPKAASVRGGNAGWHEGTTFHVVKSIHKETHPVRK